MAVLTDVELSSLIVSIANAVVEANDVLNGDPDAGLAITEFAVDVSMVATLTAPSKAATPRFRLVPSTRGTFKVAPLAARVPAARLSQVLSPSPLEMALPSVQNRTSKVEIRAVISTVPSTTT